MRHPCPRTCVTHVPGPYSPRTPAGRVRTAARAVKVSRRRNPALTLAVPLGSASSVLHLRRQGTPPVQSRCRLRRKLAGVAAPASRQKPPMAHIAISRLLAISSLPADSSHRPPFHGTTRPSHSFDSNRPQSSEVEGPASRHQTTRMQLPQGACPAQEVGTLGRKLAARRE